MGRLLVLIALLLVSSEAQARHHRHHHYRHVAQTCIETWVVTQSCDKSKNPFAFLNEFRSIKVNMTRQPARRSERRIRHIHRYVQEHGQIFAYAPYRPSYADRPRRPAEVIGGRPHGCPYQYCGCFASLQVFGRIIPSLNLAANWGRFPSARPEPGHVAYRRHHVFVIREVYGDGTVLALDGNSGRHLTRIHRVSLRGYRVVNPHG